MKKIIAIILILFPLCSHAFAIGVVSDIQVDNKSKNEFSYFLSTINEIKSKNPDVIIACGDLTYGGDKFWFNQYKSVDGVFWVKGDDDGKNFSILGSSMYKKDIGNTRIIVLDTNQSTKKQYSFLKEALKTDKDVVIAMHIPAFSRSFTKPSKDFMKLLTPNVKVILSGHLHKEWSGSFGGYRFESIPRLYSGNYKMINLTTPK